MISVSRSTRVLLLAASGLALAAPVQAANSYEVVTGGGITSFMTGTSFGFTAHNGPHGPSGHATLKNKNLAPELQERKGHVYCLRVEGNRAIFGIEDRNDDGTTTRRQFFVEDNGNPSKGQSVDRIGGADDPNCEADPRTYTPTGLVISNGNIQVRDA